MLNNLKSIFILKTIINNLSKRKYLSLIINNKNLQNKLNITIDTYIKYSNQIEVEIIPDKNKIQIDDNSNKFINIIEKNDEPFYHMYFNWGKEEIKRDYIKHNENITKINILIELEVKSILFLFYKSLCIKEIKFIKFNRTDFTDYQHVFYSCINLINLDISKLKTDKVTIMTNMFDSCFSLKHLD